VRRHFDGQQDLLERVKRRALAMLADRTLAALAAVPAEDDPGRTAEARLLAAGRAYVDFARSEPGCFATAFRRTTADAFPSDGGAEMREAGAFVLLGSLIDELVAAGRMPAAARPGAEYAAWSTVHGIAVLLLDGPLRHLDRAAHDAAVERTFRLVVDGPTGARAQPVGVVAVPGA
jgi:AcrR family transcriptional regulator